MSRIGIFGGTFDPPHIGHLIMAEEVRYALTLDEIWFIPTNIPPHKQKASSTSKHRLAMLEMAIRSNQHFIVNPIEVENENVSYTIDTMTILRKNHPDAEFYFIIGADMVEYLPYWKQVDELFKMVTFVGVQRTNYTLST